MSLLRYIIEGKKERKKHRYNYTKRTYMIDKETAEELKNIAAEMGVSTSYIVRELIRTFIAEYKKELEQTTTHTL
jgi:predicted DNA-binding protein